MAAHGYLAALAATLIWGLVVAIVRTARQPGYLGVAFSMPAGLVVLALFYFCGSAADFPWQALSSRDGIWLALGGIFQFPVATMFYYAVLQSAELSTAVPLTRLKAVFVVAIAFALQIERITPPIIAASLLSITGAALLTWKSGGGRASAAGIYYALLASLSWACGDVCMRLALRSFDALAATIAALGWGTLIYFIGLAAFGRLRALGRLSGGDRLRFALHGVLSFGAGYALFFYAIAKINVSRAAIITSAWPLISSAVGILFWQERLTWRKAVGTLLLMLGVILAL